MTAKVTPETLTDEMVLRFARSKRDGSINDAFGRHWCILALGLGSPMIDDGDVVEARQRVADAINARNETEL